MRSQQYVVKQIVIVYVVYDQNQRYFIVSKIVIDEIRKFGGISRLYVHGLV